MKDEIVCGINGEVWDYGRDENGKRLAKVYTVFPKIKDQILSWKDCKIGATYFKNWAIVGWDIIFPVKLYKKVAELIELVAKEKNPKKVARGKMLGLKAVQNNHLGLSTLSKF